VSGERVTIAIANGIADVRLARPEKMNAMDLAMYEGIAVAIDELRGTQGLRCVVLSGEGRCFCAGVDLGRLGTEPALRDLGPRTHGEANLFQNSAWGWRTLPVPVIAAVHGVAFGAGCQVMLGADVRIAAPDTRISIMETRWGLVPDVAGMALIRGLLRDDVARELIYTARILSGEEAVTLGLVTRTAADPLGEAMALARTIAGQSPEAIRAAKRLMNALPDGDAASILQAEADEQAPLLASEGHRETIRAAAEQREPRFAD
jgi:enoyl-CoA hydratase/carnithine racemase